MKTVNVKIFQKNVKLHKLATFSKNLEKSPFQVLLICRPDLRSICWVDLVQPRLKVISTNDGQRDGRYTDITMTNGIM